MENGKIKYQSVDEYFEQFDGLTLQRLIEIRAIINKVCPQATEYIGYNMPAYKYHGILVYFAGYKNHIGFYALPTSYRAFASELSKYKVGKGSVQFPVNEHMPVDIITKMLQFRMTENELKVKK